MNKPEDTTQTPATPPADASQDVTTAGQVRSTTSDEYKDTPLSETFLPEAAPEDDGTPAPAATPAPATPATPAPTDKPAAPAQTPAAPATPAPETPQPVNAQNAEIIDKTKPETPPATPTVFAGKYKSVDDLRQGISELGGDPDASDDPKVLEQVYLAVQKSYTKFNQRQQKAQDLINQTPNDEPKPFELTDDVIEGMVNQIDFNKIDDARDLAKAQFQILFSTIMKNLPQMLPKQEPAKPLDMQHVASEVTRVNTITDALAYIEGRIPRLVADNNFRDSFARHLQNGKATGKYPAIVDRKVMDQVMKDFLDGAASVADEAKRLRIEQDEAKAAAGGAPDNTPAAPASVQPAADPDGDLLGDILNAKQEHDAKFNVV